MAHLALDLREMALLSALAQEPATERSPLRRLCAMALERPWGEVLEQSLPAFLDRGMVLLDGQGMPCLSSELEALLASLHAPEQVITFERQGSLAVGETLACRRGEAWVLLALARRGDLVVLSDALGCAQLAGWFAQETLGGLTFGEDPFPALSLDLALGELLVLLGVQAVYRQRAELAVPLRGAALWVSAAELAALKPQEVVGPWQEEGTGLGPLLEGASAYWASAEHLQGAARRMVERGILWATRDSWALSEELRPLVDPGLLQEVIWIHGQGDAASPTLLHILRDGCLLVEASPVSPLHVRLTGLPGPLDAEALFDRLFPHIEEAAPELEEAEEVMPEPEAEPAAQAAPVCSRCGFALQLGQRFCGNCGAPTGAAEPAPEVPTCPRCGALVPAHARFCPECGEPVAGMSG